MDRLATAHPAHPARLTAASPPGQRLGPRGPSFRGNLGIPSQQSGNNPSKPPLAYRIRQAWAAWIDGAGVTNVGVAINNPLTTKSNFIAGQNYAMLVGRSDASGNIVFDVTQSQQFPAIWSGMQIQEAPTVPVMYGLPTEQRIFVGRAAHFFARSAGLPPLSYQWQFNGTDLANGSGIDGATTPTLTFGNVSASGPVSFIVRNSNGAVTNSTTLTAVTPASGSFAATVNSNNPTAYIGR